jgi:hypothetical protein
LAGIHRIRRGAGIDEREPLERARLNPGLPLALALVRGQIERCADQKGFRLVHDMVAAVKLEPQEGLLNEVIRVVNAAAAAAEQAAELDQQEPHLVHVRNMTRAECVSNWELVYEK